MTDTAKASRMERASRMTHITERPTAPLLSGNALTLTTVAATVTVLPQRGNSPVNQA
ncbi:hypothetical protein [Halomonas cibimaris]|uniref:hypothetical protein n=1 Tax=Halomonas cibimaris TaxID=657012 RepID=UPI0031D935B8